MKGGMIMFNRIAAALTAAALAGGASPALAGEQVIEAFAPMVAVGTQQAAGADGLAGIDGKINGPFYVMTEVGPIEAGVMLCQFKLIVDTMTNKQLGSGTCTIEFPEDARIFATLSCAGFHTIGCKGDFTLTGGEGRFKGITGGGGVTFRGRATTYLVTGDGDLMQTTFGIAYWEKLAYKLPD